MFKMIWPLGLVVLSNVFYHITTKFTPRAANAFLSLTVTYVVAGIVSFAAYFLTAGHSATLRTSIQNLNWTSFVLGLAIIGLEVGYIFIYRSGWKVSVAPIVSYITLATVLMFVGYFLFKEHISIRQIIGFVICVMGLILVTK